MQDIFKGKLFLTNRVPLICGFIVATTLFIESISLSAISLQLQPYTLKHKFIGGFLAVVACALKSTGSFCLPPTSPYLFKIQVYFAVSLPLRFVRLKER